MGFLTNMTILCNEVIMLSLSNLINWLMYEDRLTCFAEGEPEREISTLFLEFQGMLIGTIIGIFVALFLVNKALRKKGMSIHEI